MYRRHITERLLQHQISMVLGLITSNTSECDTVTGVAEHILDVPSSYPGPHNFTQGTMRHRHRLLEM